VEKEGSPDYDEVGVGKQVLSIVLIHFQENFTEQVDNPKTIFVLLDFKGQIYYLPTGEKFGPNICGKILSLLKSREFCHVFQQIIDSLIFVLRF